MLLRVCFSAFRFLGFDLCVEIDNVFCVKMRLTIVCMPKMFLCDLILNLGI